MQGSTNLILKPEVESAPGKVLFVLTAGAFLLGAVATVPAWSQAATVVYRCPGDPSKRTTVEYTDQLSAKEAAARGCKTLEGAPITIMETVKPRGSSAAGPPASAAANRGADSRVDPNEQRARDSDARRILEGELAREQERLDAALKEYNNGEPERRGDERNYQKYIDRVADLKSSIERRQSDINAIKRELSKLPQ